MFTTFISDLHRHFSTAEQEAYAMGHAEYPRYSFTSAQYDPEIEELVLEDLTSNIGSTDDIRAAFELGLVVRRYSEHSISFILDHEELASYFHDGYRFALDNKSLEDAPSVPANRQRAWVIGYDLGRKLSALNEADNYPFLGGALYFLM